MAAREPRILGVRRLSWRRPRLSVVVPVYNVSRYVGAALESVLAQPLREISAIELIVVDDGSTDASREIVSRLAATDRRVTLLTQANGGVSAARHAGIAAATGDLLTFVDPDDVLRPDAWSGMLRTLRRTGSDFVVGSAERVTDDGSRFVTPLMRRNHAHERLAVSIEEAPLMLADVFAWNKIFDRRFWVENRISFPLRTRYQDQVALTQAFLSADRFDVVTDVVYDWRVRGDGTSATQRRGQLANLRERIATKRQTLELVRAHGSPALMDALVTEVLPIDMWQHFRAAVHPLVESPEEYWRLLRGMVREFWYDAGVPFERTTVPPAQRVMAWLVAGDRRGDLARWIDMIDRLGGPARALEQNPFRDEQTYPPALVPAA
ncbi:MAG: glycosyltransferase [Nocardioides sp.]|nr:glycosyltransferase [Nocardioides sp.]